MRNFLASLTILTSLALTTCTPAHASNFADCTMGLTVIKSMISSHESGQITKSELIEGFSSMAYAGGASFEDIADTRVFVDMILTMPPVVRDVIYDEIFKACLAEVV